MNDPLPESRTFQVQDDHDGERLDLFLVHCCPDLSRNQIQNALKARRVAVDGKVRPKAFKLAAGQEVHFQPLSVISLAARPQDIPLSVVYEDADIIVVNKPAGMVVHPAPGHYEGTLVNALLHHCHRLAASTDLIRPGIVHRIDRDTSGLLVVALNDQAHRGLAEQLQERRLGRRYLALSWGRWADENGVLEDSLGRHPRDRQKMAVVTSGGKSAKTHFKVVEDFDFVQLCRVKLATGRTHQIRVQFAHAGHPVVGDPLYGDDRRARNVRPVERQLASRMVKSVQRQMLHAQELVLEHPRSGESLAFTADPPADMTAVLNDLRETNTASHQ